MLMLQLISKSIVQVNPKIEQKLNNLFKCCSMRDISELLKLFPSKDDISLENLFIIVYCIISDFLNAIGGSKSFRRSNNNNPEFTDAEIITIAIVGELCAMNSQRAWYKFVRKNFLYLFPRICHRTRYVRRVIFLHDVICMLQKNLCCLLDASCSKHLIIDSFPIEICNMQRIKNSSKPFEYDGANFGYCAAKKIKYYGFKCHIVSDLRGIPIFVCLTSASMSDLHAFEFVVEQMLQAKITKNCTIVIGDKGYVGEKFQQDIFQKYGVILLSMEREYDKDLYGKSPLNEALKPTRKLIETTINLFEKEFNAGHTRRRTIKGLISSLIAKLSAFNLANFLNNLLGEPLLQIKSFVY